MLVSAAAELKFHFSPKTNRNQLYTPTNNSRITCVSWSKDNSYLIYQCENYKPEIISLKDANIIKLVHTVTAINDVSALAFQRTTKKCIGMGTQNGHVVLYDTKSKTINKLFENLSSPVRHMDFNAGDEYLAVACVSGNAVLYDVEYANVCGNYIISDTVEPTALRFHPNLPNILAAASEDGSVMLWDTITANKTFCSQNHTSPVSGIAFGKQHNDILVSVGEDNKFCIHDLHARNCIFRSSTQHALSAVDISLDGGTIAIGSQEGLIYIYDVRNFLQPITSWRAHTSRINKLLFQNAVKDASYHILDTSVADGISKRVNDNVRMKILCYDEKGITSDTSSKLSIISSKKSVDKAPEQKQITPLKELKKGIISTIENDSKELSTHLKMHMQNLEGFIENEFHKMDTQMNDKWELVNLASANLTRDNDEASFTQSLGRSSNEPLILE